MDEKIRRLFLCRHGKTEANEKGIYCGGTRESPLNDEGKRQIMLLGKALKKYYDFQGKFIVATERKRTQETASIIGKNFEPELSVIITGGLEELNLGKWCGKTSEEVQKLFPKEHEEWRKKILKPTFRFYGGESLREARKRMLKRFDLIKNWWLDNSEEENNDLIIVAHGGTNMMIIASILNVKMKTFAYRSLKQDNACLNIIGFCKNHPWRPETQIILVNSTHHLDIYLRKI